MELGKLIFAAVVFLIILIFIMFPEARTLFSGITRVFIKDMASTPEGAAAIYSEKSIKRRTDIIKRITLIELLPGN